MLRRAALPLALATVTLGTVAAAAAPPSSIRLVVSPSPAYALEPTRIDVRAGRDASVTRLRVQAVSPSGAGSRVRTSVVRKGLRRGTFRFPVAGAWRIVVTDEAGARIPAARPQTVRVLMPRPTPPPEGFGALGAPRCAPASPADPSQRGLRDVFGTALAGDQLWALPFVPSGADWAGTDSAVFSGLVGKEMKIVFGMTAFHAPFQAVGPGDRVLTPKWGPDFHSGSSWDRQPGVEWGAGFVFPAAGCWRIEAGARGSLYFSIRS